VTKFPSKSGIIAGPNGIGQMESYRGLLCDRLPQRLTEKIGLVLRCTLSDEMTIEFVDGSEIVVPYDEFLDDTTLARIALEAP
jgi:hypothetical protein